MGYYGENGLEIYCDSGDLAETDECPCGCPSFEGRSIIYVDKHASGTGDGSSWADAYTDIQTAINAHPKKEIQIQGYGENDYYPGGIDLIECSYVKGIDDVWINGENSIIYGISGAAPNSRIESINIKKCKYYGVFIAREAVNVTVKNLYTSSQGGAFVNCESLSNCVADDIHGGESFKNCFNMDTCLSKNSNFGFWNGVSVGPFTLTNCTADNHSWASFSPRPGSTLINCTSKNQQTFYAAFGGVGDCIYENCVAFNNQGCGFIAYSGGINTYINCSEYNNCLAWGGDCSGQGCDAV